MQSTLFYKQRRSMNRNTAGQERADVRLRFKARFNSRRIDEEIILSPREWVQKADSQDGFVAQINVNR